GGDGRGNRLNPAATVPTRSPFGGREIRFLVPPVFQAFEALASRTLFSKEGTYVSALCGARSERAARGGARPPRHQVSIRDPGPRPARRSCRRRHPGRSTHRLRQDARLRPPTDHADGRCRRASQRARARPDARTRLPDRHRPGTARRSLQPARCRRLRRNLRRCPGEEGPGRRDPRPPPPEPPRPSTPPSPTPPIASPPPPP